jgi:hypothetical protein
MSRVGFLRVSGHPLVLWHARKHQLTSYLQAEVTHTNLRSQAQEDFGHGDYNSSDDDKAVNTREQEKV